MIEAYCQREPKPTTRGHFPEGLIRGEKYHLRTKLARGNVFVLIYDADKQFMEHTTPKWVEYCFGKGILTHNETVS